MNIVKIKNKYYIKKRTLVGVYFFDQSDGKWWPRTYICSTFSTFDKADEYIKLYFPRGYFRMKLYNKITNKIKDKFYKTNLGMICTRFINWVLED